MVRHPSNIAADVEIRESRFAELLVTVGMHQHPIRWETLDAGAAGRQAIDKAMSPELRSLLAELGFNRRRAEVWGELLAWAWRRDLDSVEPAVVAIAEADESEVNRWQASLPEPERRDGGWLRERLARAIDLWYRDVFAARETEVAAALHADAEAKRRLATELPVEELVDIATNGVAWAPSATTPRAVLIPSLTIRPWVLHQVADDSVIFAYPVSDPAPDRIVRLSRVLGDESRVAALRLLAERAWTLQELADELGLRKSTMHHHLAQLRAAGFLRVRFNTKSYSLRRRPLEELGAAIGALGRDS